MPPIRTLLVANRGEIARRIFRTCRDRGIRTVAVFSSADRDAPHAREADVAVWIGESEPSQSYLNVDAILGAAKRTGADALHPGYGFLSENAEFAEQVIANGLNWVGPSPAAMRRVGSKTAARQLARELGISVVPGAEPNTTEFESFAGAAAHIGYPVLIKASAGGGGRGMRRVDAPEDLRNALRAAEAEAVAGFRDGTLLLEKYLHAPRHIEVQVFGDTHGHVIHLGERECSIQRRHQKVIEEAPSPFVGPLLRDRLGEAAVRFARAAQYTNAGTVEFLVDAEQNFYLLEMNARLQVEHPVTEAITGLDLVALQLDVAEGRTLPLRQDELRIHGHAIELRVCAEDPARDFLPAAGHLWAAEFPAVSTGERSDTAYDGASTVHPFYDALLAKLIAWGPDRSTASRRAARLVERAWAPGLSTNLSMLRQILHHSAWQDAATSTDFLDRHPQVKCAPANFERGAVAATIVAWAERRAEGADPIPSGFRLTGPSWSTDRWRQGDATVDVAWRTVLTGVEVEIGETTQLTRVLHLGDGVVRVEIDAVQHTWRYTRRDGDADDPTYYFHFGTDESFVVREPRFAPPTVRATAGSCTAPIPGKVLSVDVAAGDPVHAGQLLVRLESMKLEQRIVSPRDGVVRDVLVTAGDRVERGHILLHLEGEPLSERANPHALG